MRLPLDDVPRSIKVIGEIHQHDGYTRLLGQHGQACQQRTRPHRERARSSIVPVTIRNVRKLKMVQFRTNLEVNFVYSLSIAKVIGGCIQKFPDWSPGARTAYGTVLCH
jgi:hypothetical protein